MPNTTDRCDVAIVGSLNVDRVHRLPALPSPGETVIATTVETVPGGKGLNQAVAAARAGASTRLVGAIGHDTDGQWLLEHLVTEGIGHRAVTRDTTHSTGSAVVAVDTAGKNSIIVDPGANAALHLDQAAIAALQNATIVLVSCEIASQAITDALRHATGTRILNPAPAHDIDDDVLAQCDIVTPNTHELAALAGTTTPYTVADAIDAARLLHDRHPTLTVIATLGPDGVIVLNATAAHHFAAPVVDAIDTTGAGDCFNGYLAANLAQGADIHTAAAIAIRAASISVTRPGSSTSLPYRNELS